MKCVRSMLIGFFLCIFMSFSAFASGKYEETDRGNAYIVTENPDKVPILNKTSISLLNTQGMWHEDENGWWFEYSGGGYPSNTWEEIDYYWYYFKSYAVEHLIPSNEDEYQEILSMKDDVLYHINYGGARTELSRDVEADEIEMERAYKVYANSELLKAKNIKHSLESSHYIWQIPVYTDDSTVLVDITKVTSIPDDIPEDAKEMLEDDLNRWTVGATYIYKAEIMDYDSTVITSLAEAGYSSDEYSYEIVSGIPGIRYPVAIIFDAEENPKFIIPAEKATTYAFDGAWPTAAEKGKMIATPSNVPYGVDEDANAFPVYYFDDVVRASNSYNPFGIGGIGLSYKKDVFGKNALAILTLGASGILFVLRMRKKR